MTDLPMTDLSTDQLAVLVGANVRKFAREAGGR